MSATFNGDAGDGAPSRAAGLAGPGRSGREAAADGSSHSSESALPLTLRPATEADLDEIWVIESDVFGAEAWSREMMREELGADHRTYLALVGEHDEVLGYGGLLSVGTEGDIQTIALKPGVRGSGQGRRLMTSLLHAAAAGGVREVFLEVRADNPIAQSLYLSLGFEAIGVRPGYYQPDNVDAVVMKAQVGEMSPKEMKELR